jgi:CHAT domain-containing protein/tetratricopeptide (TPR) repeat protein
VSTRLSGRRAEREGPQNDRPVVLACLLAALAACSHGTGAGPSTPAPPPGPPPLPTLEAVEGAVVEARLEPGERHVFPLELEEGTYVEVHVDRPERELRIALFDSLSSEGPYVTGERATGFDGQMLWEVTRAAGEHKLVAANVRNESTTYRLEVSDLRPATERDWSRHRGMRMFEQGQALIREMRPVDAIEKFREARELFARGDYERGIAATYGQEGLLDKEQGRRNDARAAYREAAKHWRLGDDFVSEVNAWANLSVLDRNDGDYENAAKSLAIAEKRAREEEDQQALARTFYHYCWYYRDRHLVDRAREACEESLRISETFDLEEEMGAPLIALGQIRSGLGEPEAARAFFERAIDVLERHPSPGLEATARNSLGLLHRNEGEYLEALVFFKDSFDLYESEGLRTEAGRVLFNMGTTYALLGDLDKTLELYLQALRRMEDANYLISRVEVLRGIAWAQREIGDLDAAQRTLDDAIALSPEAENPFLRAYDLQQRGEMLLELAQPLEARELLDSARAHYAEIQDWRQVAIMLRRLAAADAALGRHDDALSSLREAIGIHRKTQQLSGLAVCHYQIARIERNRGDLAAAQEAISEALAVASRIRGNAGTEDFQALYTATAKPYHDLKIDLLMEEHLRDPRDGHDARALHASENSKAQSLREIIVEADLDLDAEVPEDLQERRVELRRAIEVHERRRQLLLTGNSPNPESLAQTLLELEQALIDLEEVERDIRRASPRYSALTDPEPVSVEMIQSSLLDGDTALLEYNLGEERSFLWLVTRSELRTYVLPARSVLERGARCAHRLITAYGDPPSADGLDEDLRTCLGNRFDHYTSVDPDTNPVRAWARRRREIGFAFDEVAAELSEQLLGDARREGSLPLRLAVVSDGALEYVPFAALPTPAGAAAPDSGKELLIDRHEIVRLPSASVLAVQRQQSFGPKVTPPGLVAIVADPVYSPEDPRITANRAEPPGTEQPLAPSLRALEPLPFPPRLDLSGYEARTIASLVPPDRSRLIDGFEATPERVTGRALGDYLYVHFATHGEIDTEYPKLSSLVLSQVDEAGRRVEDGNLRLQDIYGMDLDDVDMVVLSACETALGKEVRGEGLMGLTRGFLYAGAERVAATLWQVQDVMTAELMEHFYRGLFEEDRAPADALRHAQLAVRDSDEGDYSFPYYWAGFVLQGEWR